MSEKVQSNLMLLVLAAAGCGGSLRGGFIPPTYSCAPMQQYESPPIGSPTGNVQVRIENHAGSRVEVESLCVILDRTRALPFTEAGASSWVWQGPLEASGPHELALYSYVRHYSVLDTTLFDVRSSRLVVPSTTSDLNVLGRIEPGPDRTMEVNGHVIREAPRVTWSEPASF